MVCIYAENIGFVQYLSNNCMRIVYYDNPKYYKTYANIVPAVTFSQTVFYGDLLGYLIDE